VTVYLAGPIFGCDDAECRGWRDQAKHFLGGAIKTLDPMWRDYRGREAANATDIVLGDLRDILESDVVLANVARPSWGTAMEIAIASRFGKLVFAFGACEPISPWLTHHCEFIHTDLETVCEQVMEYEELVR
jgi:nucleoside 2-deoxyribosyltransferase